MVTSVLTKVCINQGLKKVDRSRYRLLSLNSTVGRQGWYSTFELDSEVECINRLSRVMPYNTIQCSNGVI